MRRYWNMVLVLALAMEIGALAHLYLHAGAEMSSSPGFPLDDSWIYSQFARNFGEGRGMVYNPGQPMSPTGILYGVLLGGMFAIYPHPIFNANLLEVQAGVGRRLGGAPARPSR